MKKMIFAVLAAAVMTSAVETNAQDRNGNAGNVCVVERGGGRSIMPADEFFSEAADMSRDGSCVVAHLKFQNNSRRVYFNGRKFGEGLSASEADDLAREIRQRYDLSGCARLACDEYGNNGTDSRDFPRPPTSPGQGW